MMRRLSKKLLKITRNYSNYPILLFSSNMSNSKFHPTRNTLLEEVEGSRGKDVKDDGVKIQSRSIEKVRTIL